MSAALERSSGEATLLAADALRALPTDPVILLMAALAELAAGQPDRTLVLLKRFHKRYEPAATSVLLTALALGQQKRFGQAQAMLQESGLTSLTAILPWFPCRGAMLDWLGRQLADIRAGASRSPTPARTRVETPASIRGRVVGRAVVGTMGRSGTAGNPAVTSPAPSGHADTPPARALADQAAQVAPSVPELLHLDAEFVVQFEFTNPDAILAEATTAEPGWFRLREELTRLSLFEGFDELLCLPTLHGVEAVNADWILPKPAG